MSWFDHIDDPEIGDPEDHSDDATFNEPRTLTREERLAAMKEKAKLYAREQRKKAYAKAKVKMKEQRQKIKEKKQEEKLREREQKRQELGHLLKRGKELIGSQEPERQGATREETPQTEKPPIARTVGHLKLVKSQEA